MTSKIKVDNINKVSDDTNIIKKCGTTTTIGSGASNPIVVDGSAVTLGRCGGTVALASGATQKGFGRTGTVDWQTGSIKTSTFTAANGEGYFANTSGGAFTMNLPAGTAGNIVSVVDYTNTFQTNNLTIAPNGSQKIGGTAAVATLSTEGQSVTFVYVDDTEGWKNVQDSTSAVTGQSFICASVSGSCNTLTTVDTNFKVAIFKGPGTFTVNSVSTCAPFNVVDYLVVAGGGSGGKGNSAGAGGGGAGGLRVSPGTSTGCWTASPRGASPAVALPVSAQGYPIVVGAGAGCTSGGGNAGGNGGVSTFSTITSAGGGGGSGHCNSALAGGSGGGGNPICSSVFPAGAGNTPPVSPPQGMPGGTGVSPGGGYPSAGGGGAISAGVSAPPNNTTAGRAGGAGAQVNICGNNYYWAGGGGGSAWTSQVGGAGGAGGGGGAAGQSGGGAANTQGINNSVAGSTPGTGQGGAGGANTGGGGGGANNVGSPNSSGSGGSGIVILRYKFQ